MNRRGFLATALSASRVLGANDRVRVALIGCGQRGLRVAGLMSRAPHTEFVVAADSIGSRAAQASRELGCQRTQDFRRVLDRKDVDALLIARPHADAMVLSCAAGKDVYVEAPLAATIEEAQAMMEAARGRVVQVGTPHRSSRYYRDLRDRIRGGELGEVRFVRASAGPSDVHLLDTIHFVMDTVAPVSASAVGSRFAVQFVFEYPRFLLSYETAAASEVTYYGSKGSLSPVPDTEVATELHARNFIDCVRSRAEPHSPIASGYHAALAAHWGRIAFEAGATVRA
jgi:predicted dehydrogenase